MSANATSPMPDDSAERRMWVLIWYLVILPALWVAPLAYTWLKSKVSRKESSTAATTAPSTSAASASSSAAKLEEAEQSRRRLHTRVTGAVWQVGWMLIHLSCLPYYATSLYRWGATPTMDIQQVVGNFVLHAIGLPWGLFLLTLSLQPTEAKRIRGVLKSWILLAILLCGLFINGVYTAYKVGLDEYGLAIIFMTWPLLLVLASCVHSLWGHKFLGGEPLPPRRQLLALWLGMRFWLLTFGVAWLAVAAGSFACWKAGPRLGKCASQPWHGLLNGISFTLCALISTAGLRGRVTRWLGSLGKRGGAEQKAASVASLLGDTSVAQALSDAQQRFRGQPLSTLTLEALMNNEPDPTLHANTVSATLGEVHAFMSHSWSDDGRAKYEKLHEWARELGTGDKETLIWLDKACIDQLNIDASLMCLPVFLSGCQQLLLLVGPSYVTRLWCVMECFIFMRIKGIDETAAQQTSHLKVKELSSDADLAQTLSRFKAANAQCRYDRDRQRLLAVIEASFGTTRSFDELVLKVFNAQVFGVVEAARANSRRNLTRGVS